jgi:hypothetical protein
MLLLLSTVHPPGVLLIGAARAYIVQDEVGVKVIEGGNPMIRDEAVGIEWVG